jgi:hypothetical protein
LIDRKEKVLRHVDKNGHGVEIGPSYNPIAPKKEGYDVHIIDYMSREQLIARHKGVKANIESVIEEVDFVWKGESYEKLTGRSKYYDWIIASHVIEHTPDFIGFLEDCDSILKDDGVVSLVVPDKRFCYDHYRPVTGISRIIDSHFQKNTIHTPGTAAEACLDFVSKAGAIVWDSSNVGRYEFVCSIEDAAKGMKRASDDKTYWDFHAWCFVPHSFRLIIHDLFCLGFIPFQEVDFSPTVGFEFFVTLGRNGKGINRSRLEMLGIVESEIRHEEPTLSRIKRFIPLRIRRSAPILIRRLLGRSL